eukprot:RCo048961
MFVTSMLLTSFFIFSAHTSPNSCRSTHTAFLQSEFCSRWRKSTVPVKEFRCKHVGRLPIHNDSHTCCGGDYTGEETIARLYRQHFQHKVNSRHESDLSFIVFRPTDGVGWGNRLQGQQSAFLFALLTGRLFVADHRELHLVFMPPEGIEWEYSKLSHLFPSSFSSRVFSPTRDLATARLLYESNLTKAFPERVLWQYHSAPYDYMFATNINYQSVIRHLFGTSSRWARACVLNSFLLSRPQQRLISTVEDLQANLGWDKFTTRIGLQIRAFFR